MSILIIRNNWNGRQDETVQTLETEYLGCRLDHPIIASAHPRHGRLQGIIDSANHGASMVVLPSIFEEDIEDRSRTSRDNLRTLSFIEGQDLGLELAKREGITWYLDLLSDARKAVDLPLVASVSCNDGRAWPLVAQSIESSGAHALELNLGIVSTPLFASPRLVEKRIMDIVSSVRRSVSIPISVKLGQEFSALPHLVKKFSKKGVEAVVFFNRYYAHDVKEDLASYKTGMKLSHEKDYLLSLRFISLLYKRIGIEFCASGGIHSSLSGLKLMAAGASAFQLCTLALLEGAGVYQRLRGEMVDLMKDLGVSNFSELRSRLKRFDEADPEIARRHAYINALSQEFPKH